jgi:hypothetical protein
MVTFEQAAEGIRMLAMAMHDTKHARRARRTLSWVVASCRADGLPEHLVWLVWNRVYDALMAGDFPLLADPPVVAPQTADATTPPEPASQPPHGGPLDRPHETPQPPDVGRCVR